MVLTQKQNNNQQFLLEKKYSGQESLRRIGSVLGKLFYAWTSLWKELNRRVTLKICLLFFLPSCLYTLGILLSEHLQLITQPILKIHFRKVTNIHKLNIICSNPPHVVLHFFLQWELLYSRIFVFCCLFVVDGYKLDFITFALPVVRRSGLMSCFMSSQFYFLSSKHQCSHL